MLFGDRSCPVLSGVPDPLPDFSETSRELPARLVPGVFLRLGEGVCLLRDRDSGKADDLVISATMAKQAGDSQVCLRCKKGPSFHGGHTRSGPPMRLAWMFQ